MILSLSGAKSKPRSGPSAAVWLGDWRRRMILARIGPSLKEGNMRRSIALTAVLIAALVLAACAPGPNSLEKTTDTEGKTAGFFFGLWHGFISPVTFIVSVFSKNVRLYEVHNSGTWYNFGFVVGAGLFLSGGILGRKKKRS
jgi:hypothetical protein